jgi:hypothetical protein
VGAERQRQGWRVRLGAGIKQRAAATVRELERYGLPGAGAALRREGGAWQTGGQVEEARGETLFE